VEILCPLGALHELDPLLEAGARQFYSGVDSAVLFGAAAAASPILNCRPWPGCNFDSEAEVHAACSRVHQRGGRLHLAFNWFCYRRWELDAILAFLDRHDELDGIIVADVTLLDLVRARHPRLRIILGTIAQVQNGRAAELFRRRGVSQIVLPRHLTLDEIAKLVEQNRSVAFEVFIKNQDCFFSQGLCYYTHDRVDPAVEYKCSSIARYVTSRALTPHEVVALRGHVGASLRSCGVCAIRELAQRGVAAVKIAGRERPLERKVQDVTFLRRALETLQGMAPQPGARAAAKRVASRDRNPGRGKLADAGAFGARIRTLHEEIYGEACRRDCMY
jgi:U32 family peptidase